MNPTPKTMPERVMFTRKRWGWSQYKLAAVLHCNQGSVSFWESGKVCPNGAALVALAALMGCTVEALETGKGFEIPGAPALLPCFTQKD